MIAPHLTDVPAGSSYEATEWLTMGLSKYFPEPGNYEIQAMLTDDRGKRFVRSNKVLIQLKNPIGEEHRAYQYIKKSGFQDDFFGGGDVKGLEDAQKEIASKYPTTPYGNAASFLLGEEYYLENRYEEALAQLRKLESDVSFVFAEKVKEYLKNIRSRMKK
jgi:hypothetical protein